MNLHVSQSACYDLEGNYIWESDKESAQSCLDPLNSWAIQYVNGSVRVAAWQRGPEVVCCIVVHPWTHSKTLIY